MIYSSQLKQDEKYLGGLWKRDDEVQKEHLPTLLSFARSIYTAKRWNEDDVKDVFQEALIVIFRRAVQTDFAFTS